MFEPGRIYRRADVRHEWGGETELQWQGGILTPAEAPARPRRAVLGPERRGCARGQ